MRALVTGAGGQLGVELVKTAPKNVGVVALSHAQCDITDSAELDRAMALHRPDVVINAAAYTAVDEAEARREYANSVNATGAGNVVRAAGNIGARVIHVSTDYVFDGENREPYRPDSRTNPINAYGESKRSGEEEIQCISANFLIIRSGWLYASHGKNFLRTVLSSLREMRPLRVVTDQIGVPTSAASLAFAIWACSTRADLNGIHHWVDGGTASWFDFATAIREFAVKHELVATPTPIAPIATREYSSLARRPPYSVLDARTLWQVVGQPPFWKNALELTISEMHPQR